MSAARRPSRRAKQAMQRIVDAAERRRRGAEPFAALPFLFEYRLLEADETLDVLDRLNQLYIGARYPGERGLLPEGQPTQEEARQFHRVATQFYERIHQRLEDE